jgi:hypothetical protein
MTVILSTIVLKSGPVVDWEQAFLLFYVQGEVHQGWLIWSGKKTCVMCWSETVCAKSRVILMKENSPDGLVEIHGLVCRWGK